jgi:cation diffusion facilitator CzcD-associated flavoprotein CzcO
MTKPLQKFNIVGTFVTIIVTAGFIAAAFTWNSLWLPRKVSPEDVQKNLQLTFLNLKAISAAQEEYKKTDWDNDGKKQYAKFYIHLWRSVGLNGDPINVNLIPKKLAFAIESSRALNTYYFTDLHDMTLADNKLEPLDYEKQWAILAQQPNENQKEILYFLADNTGNIFAKSAKYVQQQYPPDPIAAGWTKIDSIDQLKAFTSF